MNFNFNLIFLIKGGKEIEALRLCESFYVYVSWRVYIVMEKYLFHE